MVGHLSTPFRSHDLAERGIIGGKPEVVEGAAGAEGEDGIVLRQEHAVGLCVCGGQIVRPFREPRQGLATAWVMGGEVEQAIK